MAPLAAPACNQPDDVGKPHGHQPMQQNQTPLSAYSQVDTAHVDEAEHKVGELFCAHSLSPSQRRPDTFRALHNHVAHEGYSINYVRYGCPVEINPGKLDKFYLLQIPLTGGSELRCGAHRIHTGPKTASLISPTLETTMRWHAETGQLIVLLERARVEKMFAALTGVPVPSIEFRPDVHRTAEAGAAICAQAELMRALSEAGTHSRLSHQQLRDTLTTLLLSFQPHGHSHMLEAPASAPAPRHVRRAEDHIVAHLEEDLCLATLATACGVSLRTLQTGFRQFRNTTISAFIKDRRLERWHQLLSDPSCDAGVVALAQKSGLSNPGRSAFDYACRYGCKPSETRRRALRPQ